MIMTKHDYTCCITFRASSKTFSQIQLQTSNLKRQHDSKILDSDLFPTLDDSVRANTRMKPLSIILLEVSSKKREKYFNPSAPARARRRGSAYNRSRGSQTRSRQSMYTVSSKYIVKT